MANYPSIKVNVCFTILPLVIEIIISSILLIAYLFIMSGEQLIDKITFTLTLAFFAFAFYAFIPLIIINLILANYLAKKEFVISEFSDYLHIGKVSFISWFIPLTAVLIYLTLTIIFSNSQTLHQDFSLLSVLYYLVLAIFISLIHSAIVMVTGRFIFPMR